MQAETFLTLALTLGDTDSQTAAAVTTLPALHFLPCLPPSFSLAATSTLDLCLSPIMVLLGCLGNTCYFIGLSMSSMGRNTRPEASVLQAKSDSQEQEKETANFSLAYT